MKLSKIQDIIKIGDVATIHWQDATHSSSVKMNIEKYVKNYEPYIRKSTGVIVGINETAVFLINTDDRDNKDSPHCVQDTMAVPPGIIRTIIAYVPDER